MHKSRFLTLDGVRGVAALLVVLFHVSKVYALPSPQSAYLAVDMFFALSGFVLARTYLQRFNDGMTARAFIITRVKRLWPLYLLGLAIGLVDLGMRWWSGSIVTMTFVGSAVFGSVLLPAPVPFQPHRLFPANGPAWSLFCEFWIANVGMALFWRWVKWPWLAAGLAISAVALIAFGIDHQGLDLGSTWSTLPQAIARIAFSFTAGVALWLFYVKHPPSVQIPSGLLLSVIALVLCMPSMGGFQSLYDLMCILFVFPLLIYLGAGAKERRPQIGSVAGELSYAIYIIHSPLLLLWLRVYPGNAAAGDYVMGALFFFFVVGVSYAAQRVEGSMLKRGQRIGPSGVF